MSMVSTDERVALHVLIYGPPAAGKLTVARALSEAHALRLLDNHATLDPVLRLFPFGHPELGRTVETIRVALYSAAARAGLSVVSTLVFAHPIDRQLVINLQHAASEAGGQVAFVQLRTSREVLEQRVLEASRRGSEKIKDLRRLHALLDDHDLVTPIHDDDLSIDNTHVSAKEAADLIANHLGLGRRSLVG